MNIQPAVIILVGVVISVVGVVISGIGGFLAAQQQASSELKLANSLIGGDSFCYFGISPVNPKTNTVQLYLLHPGEHNLYDVHATIVDVDKLHQLFEAKLSLNKADTNISIGNLIPSARELFPLSLGNGNTRSFNVRFSARNGFFKQLLWFKKIHGEWVYATQVTRGSKVLYEQADEEFPRTAMGNVEWDEFGMPDMGNVE